MQRFAIIMLITLLTATTAQARPVSYPGGWTVMIRNDADQNSVHAHYTLDPQHSVGARIRYDREGDFTFTGAQVNRLVKRWNKIDSQANVYGRIALGAVTDNLDGAEMRDRRSGDEALFIGASADWETRRYFISADVEYWDNGRFGDFSSYHSRIGIAPYVAGTGALHTWLMIEGHHRPEGVLSDNDAKLGGSALVRFFKGPALLELGLDNDAQPLINYIHRF